MVGTPTRFVHGGPPQAPGDWNRNQIQAGVTMLQPAAIAFRLSDALQKATYTTSSNAGDISQLEEAVAELQGQVGTLSTQIATLQSQIAALQSQMTNVQNYLMFTQAEQPTGMIFLDNNQIYKRSWAVSSVNVVNNVYTIAHGIQSLAYLAQAQGVMGVANSTNIPMTWINSALALPQWGDATCFYIDNTNIYIVNGSTNRSSFIFLITLWYTKMTGSNDIPGT